MKYETYFLTFLAIPALILSANLSLPHGPSRLQLPSNLSSNAIEDELPHNWPLHPWTQNVGPIAVQFIKYGRRARGSFEQEIIQDLSDIMSHFFALLHPYDKPLPITMGIVYFDVIVRSGNEEISGGDVFQAVSLVLMLIDDLGWDAIEIEYAEIFLSDDPQTAVAGFSILFEQV